MLIVQCISYVHTAALNCRAVMLDNEHLRNLVNRLQSELGRAQSVLGKDAQSLHRLDAEADQVNPTPSWVFESETMTPLLVAYDHRIKVSSHVRWRG